MTIDVDVLPIDTVEELLSSIEAPHDLLAFALTSRCWADLIIPKHIQYRKLYLGPEGEHWSLWAHLAERKDLAKNIREVRLSWMGQKWERHPTSLVSLLETPPDNVKEGLFLQAFRNFEKLESFTWKPHMCPTFMDPYRSYGFLEILTNGKCLDTVDLTRWRTQDDNTPKDERPVFGFKKLKHLHLHGSFWASSASCSLLNSMLSRCSDIQNLLLYYSQVSPAFVNCSFPRLQTLFIYGILGEGEIEGEILEFLRLHETIEELTWFPISPNAKLLPGSLPALKKISSSHRFTTEVLQDKSTPRRTLRCIGQICLNPTSMKVLEEIDGSQVRELYIWRYDSSQNMRRLGEVFPMITILDVPGLGVPPSEQGKALDDHIFTLSHFPALECILDTPIWGLILNLKGAQARQDAITKLAHACPNLRVITYNEPQRRKITLLRDDNCITWRDTVDFRD